MSKHTVKSIESDAPAGFEDEYVRLRRALSELGGDCSDAFDDERAMRALMAEARATEAPEWLREVGQSYQAEGGPPDARPTRGARVRLGLKNLLGGHSGA